MATGVRSRIMRTMKTRAFFACALVAAACAACGSDPTAAPGGADAGGDADDASTVDATADASTDAPIADAAADIEQDPNVYPAKHHPIPQVDNQGGPLLDHMTLVTVSFVGDTHRDTFRAFGHAIGTTTWWHKTLGTYGLADAIVGPDVELASLGTRSMMESEFEAYLAQQVTMGNLPPPTPQTLYVVYTPRPLSITLPSLGSSCSGFDGYHGSFPIALPNPDGGAPTTVNAAYAVVCECSTSLTEMTITAAHEIAEAATDPNIQYSPSYYMYTCDAWEQDLGGAGKAGEVGDLCSWLTWTEGTWEVQRIYSNAAAAASKNPCQPYDKLYFGAAPRTTPKLIGGVKMDGRLSIARGKSLDVILDAFSEAALPNDFSLYVGQNVGPGANGVSSIGPSITSSLSKTKVHNGNGVILTISVGATTPTGDYPFVIRSVLNASDYNDWPVILGVH